ncbi:MAG: VOC family protein [Holophagales bacterium]|nr:VOC family protein [Holophagales bacterium]
MEPTQTHGAFSWVEHHGPDAEAAQDFYTRVLGWQVAGQSMADGSSYPCIVVGEKPVGGFSPRPAPTDSAAGAGWLAYVTVDEVDPRFSAALEAGAEAVQEPYDAPGVGRMAVLRDPFGARIALISYCPEETS